MSRNCSPSVVTVRVRHLMLGVALVMTLLIGFGLGSHCIGPGQKLPGSMGSALAAFPNEPGLSLADAIARVAENAQSAVVNITTIDGVEGELLGRGTGSGFIVDGNGYILTNYHVVRDATRIKVKLSSGSELNARLVAADEETDIAVVKVSPRTKLQSVSFGDSDALRVGEWVVAIGSPFGLDQTVTAGIISAKERVTDKRRNLQQFLQTDAAINPGNSGGPLLNLAGEVIGINAQIATQDGRFNGIGFAIPSTTAKDVYRQLITQGRVSRGYLGVFLDRVSPQFAHVYGIPKEQGALIQFIDDNGPAKAAGLEGGDVIVEFDGHPIRDDRDLIRLVASTSVGTTATVSYFREGHSRTAKLRMDERPPLESARNAGAPVLRHRNDTEDRPQSHKLGIAVGTLTRLKATQLGLMGVYNDSEKGVLVMDVDPSSVASEARLRERDLIVAINRKPIANEEEYAAAIKNLKSNDDVVFAIKRVTPADHRVVSNYLSLTMP